MEASLFFQLLPQSAAEPGLKASQTTHLETKVLQADRAGAEVAILVVVDMRGLEVVEPQIKVLRVAKADTLGERMLLAVAGEVQEELAQTTSAEDKVEMAETE